MELENGTRKKKKKMNDEENVEVSTKEDLIGHQDGDGKEKS